MNPNTTHLTLISCLALAPLASGVERFKANNNTSLNQTASWTGAVVPGSGEVAVWDAPYNQTNVSLAPTLGANASWQGLRVVSPLTVPRIRFTTGLDLTLGSGGIDMSAATNSFDLYAGLIAGANQTWNVASDRTLTIGSGFSGAAGVTVTKSGPGLVKVLGTGSTTFSGNLALDAGNFEFSPASGTAVQTVGGSLSGSQPLTKSGVGALALSGDNTAYGGGVNLTAGTLKLGHASALGSGTLTITGGGLDNTSGGPLVLPGVAPFECNGDFYFSGSSNLDLGPTALTLAGNRSLTVSAGTLALGGTLSGSGASLTKLGAGTLEAKSGTNIDLDGKLAVGGGILKITGGLVGCGAVGGNLEVSGGGSVELNGGALTAFSVTRTSGAGSFRFNGGTLKPLADSSTFMTGLDSAQIGAGGAVLDLDGWFVTVGQSLLHDSSLGGTPDGGLTLRDTTSFGKLTLTGASTYTGPTIVESGTLILGPAASLTTPTLEIQAGSVLDAQTASTLGTGVTLQGSGSVLGNLTIGSGATLSPGGTSIGSMTMSDTLKLMGNATFQINKSGAALSADVITGLQKVTYGGTLTVTATGSPLAMGNTFKLFDSVDHVGNFSTFNLPALPAGLYWETTGLAVDGTITVVNTLPSPTFNPPAGSYLGAQSITITGVSGSTLHYTTDGSDPRTSPTAIAGASPLSGLNVPTGSIGYTIRAYATKSGVSDSNLTSAAYTILDHPIWADTAGGNWSNAAGWVGGIIADAAAVTADFNTLSLPANTTVTLDGARTVGSLVFGDVANASDWILAGSQTLTLSNGASTPTIQVANRTVTVQTPLAGTTGCVKTGPGTLILASNSTLTGNFVVNNGLLHLGRANYAFNTSQVLGALTVNAPGSLHMTDLCFGWGGGLATLNLNGCNVTGSSGFGTFGLVYNLRGATINTSGRLDFANTSGQQTVINSLASSTMSVFTSSHAEGMMIRGEYGGSAIFNVEQGTTPDGIDLQINNRIVPLGAAGPLVKNGAGTLELTSGSTSIASATNVNAGTLILSNTSGTATGSGAITVASGAKLGGSGFATGGLTVSAGAFLAPGRNGIGTLSTGAATVAGNYQCQVSGATTDKLAVTGNLNLTGSALNVSTIGAAAPGTYVIATFTGTLTGTFASVTSGYTVDYATPNQVKLVVTGSGDPYQTWVSGFGLSGNNALAVADPDMDSLPNGVEFVLGGNPATVQDRGLLPAVALVTNPGGTVPNGDYLRFTYRRTPASAYLNPDMQFDADLIGTWTTATGAPGVVQVVTSNFYASPTAADRVEVFVPRTGTAVNGKLFGRLRVITP